MQPKLRPWHIATLAWLTLTLLSAGWAIATPIAAAPDEPAHFVKAASVARGQFLGEPSASGHIVQVPEYVATTHARTCFAFKPLIAANCSLPAGSGEETIVDATTTAGLYNPLYYLLVGWPSTLFSGDTGLYAMRIVSGAVSSAFLALAFFLVSGWKRPTIPMLGLLVGATPMLLFLSGTVNPNAVEATATVAAFAGMLSILLHPHRDLLALRCIAVAVSASVAVNTRGLALIWVLIAVALPLILARRGTLLDLFRRRQVLTAAVVVGFASLFAVVWLLSSSSLVAGITESDTVSTVPQTGTSALAGFWLMFTGTFDFGRESVGIFGWLDTPANDAVYYVWAVFTGAIVASALIALRGRSLLAGVGVVAAFLLVPALVQATYITEGGLIWQGRYNLPLFLCMSFGLTALVSAETRPAIATHQLRRGLTLFLVAWTGTQVLTFATTLRRYAVGGGGTWKETFLEPAWAAPGGNIAALLSFAIVAITGAVLLVKSLSQTVPTHITLVPLVDMPPQPRKSTLNINSQTTITGESAAAPQRP